MANPQTPTTQAVEQLREAIENNLHDLGKMYTTDHRDNRHSHVKYYADQIQDALADTLKIVGGEIISRNEDDPNQNARWQAYRNELRNEQHQRLELVVGKMKCK